MSGRKSSYEYDSELTSNERDDYDMKSSNDNDSNDDLDDSSDLSELDLSDEDEEETDDDEYEWAPTVKEQKSHIREREREKKNNTKGGQSSSQNSFVIPHESVFIPMGTKDSIDKMLAYRSNPKTMQRKFL